MRTAFAAAVGLLALFACSQSPRVNVDPDSGRVDVDVEPTGQRSEGWRATLAPVGGSGVSGTGEAHVQDELTHALVNITGARAGGVHPWHVHEGECDDSSPPIVGPASAYPPLNVGAGGRASAEVNLTGIELNEAKSYIINVHRSPSDLTVIACGPLDD